MDADGLSAVRRSEYASLVDLLRRRAREQATDRAYIVLSDRGGEEGTVTFSELQSRASELANRLCEIANPGDRALLLFPTGIDFIVSFFACLMARVIAAPMMVPRRTSSRDATGNILRDCRPRVALTSSNVVGARADLLERFASADLSWICVDQVTVAATNSTDPGRIAERADIAFLQYTSGSTSAPKGVMVSHGNLLDNLEMMRIAFSNTRSSTHVSWVPLFHDMGMIANVLQALYVGALRVLMTPIRFVQRPWTWLRAIHDYRAEVAGGPNFAYELCVNRYRAEELQGIDLSCWKVAFNAAEPIRAATIARFTSTFRPHGFAPEAMHPAYGLAEATVLVSSGRRSAGPKLREISRTNLQAQKAVPPAVEDDAYLGLVAAVS